MSWFAPGSDGLETSPQPYRSDFWPVRTPARTVFWTTLATLLSRTAFSDRKSALTRTPGGPAALLTGLLTARQPLHRPPCSPVALLTGLLAAQQPSRQPSLQPCCLSDSLLAAWQPSRQASLQPCNPPDGPHCSLAALLTGLNLDKTCWPDPPLLRIHLNDMISSATDKRSRRSNHMVAWLDRFRR